MFRIVAIFLLIFPSIATACVAGPGITRNKLLHLAGTAAVTTTAAVLTDDVKLGIVAGISVGLIRELYKESNGSRCELSSMVHDTIGLIAGIHLSEYLLISKDNNKISIFYNTKF